MLCLTTQKIKYTQRVKSTVVDFDINFMKNICLAEVSNLI